MYNKKSPIFLRVHLRRIPGNSLIERNVTGTDIWAEIDEQCKESLDNEDFHKNWTIYPEHPAYEYCMINLRD